VHLPAVGHHPKDRAAKTSPSETSKKQSKGKNSREYQMAPTPNYMKIHLPTIFFAVLKKFYELCTLL